jgi:SAM-dependent methyltransferase
VANSSQEAYYSQGHDYWFGSPHLKHRRLYEYLMSFVVEAVEENATAGISPAVLEIGGGDGSISERLLACGFPVIATDMSLPSVEHMSRRFSANSQFLAVYDEDGSLDVLGDQKFSTIVYSSVLHHIPDYRQSIADAIGDYLLPGGSLVTFQDPLWYPRLDTRVNKLSKTADLSWRLGQGGLMRGLGTRIRRFRHGLDEGEIADSVEYHVVRDGVDEIAISELLEPSFSTVEVIEYWSAQGQIQQRIGEMMGVSNTFLLRATGYIPPA